MKLVNPTIKYKDSYLDLVKAAKTNGDISEMGNAYREKESFDTMIKRLKDRTQGKNIAKLDVPSSMKWIIENSEVVGTIDLRHVLKKITLNDSDTLLTTFIPKKEIEVMPLKL